MTCKNRPIIEVHDVNEKLECISQSISISFINNYSTQSCNQDVYNCVFIRSKLYLVSKFFHEVKSLRIVTQVVIGVNRNPHSYPKQLPQFWHKEPINITLWKLKFFHYAGSSAAILFFCRTFASRATLFCLENLRL